MFDVGSVCARAKKQSYELATMSAERKNSILYAIADEIDASEARIIESNEIDLANAQSLSEAMRDRLRLTPQRIAAMSQGVRDVAKLDDPVGEVTEQWQRPNGLNISKVRVPLGVIGVIYESRPNVTADVAALCIKSGNCVVLRGGKEAINSNRCLYEIIAGAIKKAGVSPDIVAFVDDATREGTLSLLRQSEYVDVIIPRGGDGLKKFVLENATMPVIASAGGNCHIYVEKTADLAMATEVVMNAKLSRPSTCNALEQLLVDESVAKEFLPTVTSALMNEGCKVNGSEEAHSYCDAIEVCDENEFKKEHGDKVLTVYVIRNGVQEAVDRINENGTGHSDCIITNDEGKANYFTGKVDSACVYVNASTRFTDGFEFGFGAEIGISTQKLHARGPLGLKQLTSEKYIVKGNGQVRK